MIRENMRFNGFSDFYDKRKVLFGIYSRLCDNDKLIYKYYVYSRRYLRERTCDAIWEFLNAIDFNELADAELRLSQEYARYR